MRRLSHQYQAKLERKEIRAIFLSILFLLLGCLVVWFIKSVIKVEGDAVFVSLLLFPLLVYVILSDKLEEFKAPGGLGAKLRKAADETVTVASEVIKPSKMLIFAKGPNLPQPEEQEQPEVNLLERNLKGIDETKPIVMTLELGKKNYYTIEGILRYIDELSQFRNFKFIVFVDSRQQFQAYIPYWKLKRILNKPEIGDNFIWAIEKEESNLFLFQHHGFVKEAISIQSTNAEALREMMRQNLEALVVTNQDNGLAGIVEREQVLSRMMLSLVK